MYTVYLDRVIYLDFLTFFIFGDLINSDSVKLRSEFDIFIIKEKNQYPNKYKS